MAKTKEFEVRANKIDEDGVRDWHDKIFLNTHNVKVSLEDGHPDWDAMAFGFFIGRGLKVSEATKHVDLLRQRSLMPEG